jgi:hypothetical protein
MKGSACAGAVPGPSRFRSALFGYVSFDSFPYLRILLQPRLVVATSRIRHVSLYILLKCIGSWVNSKLPKVKVHCLVCSR